MINYDKWNRHKIGDIPWVNSRRTHLCRHHFIQYLMANTPKKVLEIGGGELIEAKRARTYFPHMQYDILDVSDTFLSYGKEQGFTCFKGEMNQTKRKDKEYDLVYLCQVLEHSPEIAGAFKELKRVSKEFYFTMFKWNIKSGNLTSNFIKRRGYYSTSFNLLQLLKLLGNYGNIKKMFICTLDGEKIDYEDYMENIDKRISSHRNGNYLSIIGKWDEN